MAAVKTQRGPVRAQFTGALKKLQEELNKVGGDPAQIEVRYQRLQTRRDKLVELDQKVEESLLEDEDTTEAAFAQEFEEVSKYTDEFTDISIVVAARLRPKDETESIGGGGAKKKYKLPKLELKKFTGDAKEWLGFWSQFKSIHEDEEMSPEDKFQYLRQGTAEKSAARDVVDSFPASAENYPRAVEYLKTRFGNEDMLREVYVRDLLQLVIRRSEKLSISRLYDQLETQLRALESLNVTRENNVALLFPMVESALPVETLLAWERSPLRNAGEGNRLTRLLDFLKLEVESEARIRMARSGFVTEDRGNKVGQKKKDDRAVPTASELLNGPGQSKKSSNCVFCDRSHKSNECRTVLKMTSAEKQDAIRKKKACFICLQRGHFSNKCNVKVSCESCGGKHLAVMCDQTPQASTSTAEASGTSGGGGTSNLSNITAASGMVLLETLEVAVKVGSQTCFIRAILDRGSQYSYVSKKLVSHVGLNQKGRVKLAHCLFGGNQTGEVDHRLYDVEVHSKDMDFMMTSEFLDQEKICSNISCVPQGPWLQELRDASISVTDINNEGREIHMLIGADIAAQLYTGRIFPTTSGPVAHETCLGWVLMGRCQRMKNSTDSTMLATTLHVSNVDLQDLWRLDLLGITDAYETKSRNDLTEDALRHFKETVVINEEGRYEISLPWIEGHAPVSTNRQLAEKRLKSAYKKIKEKGCVEDLQRIFDEWEALGVIEKVSDCEVVVNESYLPHHPVFKPASRTTPIRPVFDASAKSEGKPSLNDCLEKGPNLIELIPDVLCRFRMKKIGVVSDIKKAFLQISVKKEDRNFLKFLWWEGEHLQVYRHCRVVFGVNSSPFLLAATINFHLGKVQDDKRDVADKLLKSLYVDNSVTSLDSEDELKTFVRVATELLSSARMDLRGWVWSATSLPTMDCEEADEVVPVLGLLWNWKTDKLSLDLRGAMGGVAAGKSESESSGVGSLASSGCGLGGGSDAARVTKRMILSASQSVFDTQGFVSPVTIVPKILLQELWLRKLGWDDTVGAEEAKRFNKWRRELSCIDQLEVPRWVLQEEPGNVSLHVFADASSAAYATCVYLRNEVADSVHVQLLMSKSRVAPTKKMTIPRLELMGCVIGARLGSKCRELVDLPGIKTHYWTDSSNALYWIQKKECWATFVWNRVEEVRKLSPSEDWKHIPGELNPADLPSRGCSAKMLLQTRWWEGPKWLRESEDNWPKSQVNADLEVVMAEKKKMVVTQLSTKVESNRFFDYFSSYRKTVRMVAWMLRWRKNIKQDIKLKGRLTPEEEEAAELCIVKMLQSGFKEDDSSLKSLNAVQDSLGIWRVKTRILMRDDEEDFKCPILLPTQHKVTRMLVESVHKRNSHCGSQVLMNTLRERFWIPKARKVVREIIHRCGSCRRFTARRGEVCGAPLPLDRVRDAAAFEVTGIDLGGPLFLKDGNKVWFVVYTCAVYRAIHLELVSSVSTEVFLLSLRRFIARRGRPTTVYTDNGTNFEGSNNALKKLDWTQITEETGVHKIRWVFNPPSAPWWGGFWERMVGIVKSLLRRILGRASLELEELQTVLCDVEDLVNSRPLTYLSENPEELMPVTPSMFLTDIREHGVPDLDRVDCASLKKRLQYRQKLREDLRRRFRSEYLAYLVHVKKKNLHGCHVKKGDVVLIEFDNKKRIDWPLGHVLEVFPGRDGVARVARVKTATSELTRPLQRLFLLEAAEEGDPAVVNFKSGVDVGGIKTTVTRSGRVSKIPQRFME